MLARHNAALQALPSTAAQAADLQLGLQPGRGLSLIEVWRCRSPGIAPSNAPYAYCLFWLTHMRIHTSICWFDPERRRGLVVQVVVSTGTLRQELQVLDGLCCSAGAMQGESTSCDQQHVRSQHGRNPMTLPNLSVDNQWLPCIHLQLDKRAAQWAPYCCIIPSCALAILQAAAWS